MKYIVFFIGLTVVLLFFFSSCSDSNSDHENKTEPGIQHESMKAKTVGIDFAGHDFFQPVSNSISHIHGIGYPNNQEALFIATHHGLKVYSNGIWYETKEHNHDYMGFQATSEGFYSSGHPEEGSTLLNPLGLLKSEDFGKTIEKVSFYGESDFHHMSASYYTPSIYVVNTVPNSKLGTGLYYSLDGGEVWMQSELEGLPQASAHSLATHPRLAKIVGISTPEGLFLSHNNGNTFSLISEERSIGTFFIKDESILYVTADGEESLLEQSLESDDTKQIPLPTLSEGDSILYLAVNPLHEQEISFGTVAGDVWRTEDYGDSWSNILEKGNVP
ncbi:hypothetical protein JOC85_002713 [Bacillus mesophilus]|uniref:Sortilin N-terminal domain-containing protein n=1 Tax=Bacillus mesophilus TaxID=1808955 RepID=A0A6M0Q8Q5_9BACI|nr:hypothetical protein [Bacillus mesophilus]MBM7661906.1 hypothetical protein [Bacillus mesophilus]NEY72734.1 hypothetical protein [Bacillus mesophilus]